MLPLFSSLGFQYPPTGRCQCDPSEAALAEAERVFQYPTTGRCQCDTANRAVPAARFALSVPYHGSMPVSLRPEVEVVRAGESFQYPTTGRCQCDFQVGVMGRQQRPFSTLPRVDASVTSWCSTRRSSPGSAFSTLPRVDASVTSRLYIRRLTNDCPFSTLPRVDASVTRRRASGLRPGRSAFQYPTTGRCQCDTHRTQTAPARDTLSVPYHGSRPV